ncbi:MAG: hypothetical protein NUW37_08000 [Planctomycetes bacterium]|nr:hypothetical protein [Planctomycetota bacterium]
MLTSIAAADSTSEPLDAGAEAKARRNIDVYVIEVEDEVNPLMFNYIERRIELAKEKKLETIVFRFDTPGGAVDSMEEIVRLIRKTQEEGIRTIAFVDHWALSAGAFIALSCGEVYMRAETSVIGDCMPILPDAAGGFSAAGEKIESALRAMIRSIADQHGYPKVLLESMVTPGIEVLRVEFNDDPETQEFRDALKVRSKNAIEWFEGEVGYVSGAEFAKLSEDLRRHFSIETVVEEGKLLTMTAKDALRLGISVATVDGFDDLKERLGIAGVTSESTSWSETLAYFLTLPLVSMMLLVCGFIAMYVEIKTPGVGMPLVIAIVCFGILLASRQVAGLADHVEILILLAGIVLLLIEIFVIPGFGITGISGILCILVALFLSGQSFIIPKYGYEWNVLEGNLLTFVGSVFGSLILMAVLAHYLPSVPFFQRLSLADQPVKDTDAVVKSVAPDEVESQRAIIVGHTCRCVTDLRPSGKVQLGGERFDVVADGDWAYAGDEVVVTKVEGNRVYVRLCSKKEGTETN